MYQNNNIFSDLSSEENIAILCLYELKMLTFISKTNKDSILEQSEIIKEKSFEFFFQKKEDKELMEDISKDKNEDKEIMEDISSDKNEEEQTKEIVEDSSKDESNEEQNKEYDPLLEESLSIPFLKIPFIKMEILETKNDKISHQKKLLDKLPKRNAKELSDNLPKRNARELIDKLPKRNSRSHPEVIVPDRRKRKRTTIDQYNILDGVFQLQPFPDSETRRNLSLRLGISQRRIQVWFQNRRAKIRRSLRQKKNNKNKNNNLNSDFVWL